MNDSLLPSTSAAVPTPVAIAPINPTSTGKTLQLPIIASTCKNSDANCSSKHANATHSSQLHCCVTKRTHHIIYHQLDGNCKSPSQQQYFPTNNNNNNHSQSTMKIVSNVRMCPINRSEDVANESFERSRKLCATASPATLNAPKIGFTIKKESFSCDSISKACAELMVAVGPDGSTTASNNDASPISDYRNSSMLSVNSGTSACGSSSSSCGNNLSSTSTITACNSPMLSLSKSETNIFEVNGGDSSNKMSVFNVVSLNDLSESVPFLNRPMNDLSKIQCLNKISEQDLCSMNDHKRPIGFNANSNTAIASPTITVSVKDPNDLSDRTF